MIGSIIFVVLSMVICVAFCVLRASKATFYSLTLKILASLCFIFAGILALTVVGWGTVGIMIIVGMVFGLIGDIVLDLKIMYPEKNDTYFLIGTGSFAVGHVFYFIAGLLTMLDSGNAISLSWAIPVALVLAGVLTLGIMLSSKKMGMDFGKVKWAVVSYSVVLSFMFFFSCFVAIFNTMFWIFAAGMLVFLLSDLVLSMQYFGGKDQKIFIYINHILYYLAQCMFALFMLFGL